MNIKKMVAFGSAMVVVLASSSAFAGGDAAKGKKYFKKKCKACHQIVAEKHKMGPSLFGVFGAKSGASSFKKYTGLKGSDFVWNEENLDKFLENPKKFVGKKSMIVKVKKPGDRADAIAYLKTLK